MAVLADTSMLQAGGYISPWKCLAIVVVLLLWARLLTFIDKDSENAHFSRTLTNAATFGALLLGYLLFFFLPGFVIAFPVLILVMIADVGAYLFMRNKAVGLEDLKKDLANAFKGKGKREKEVKAEAGQVMVFNKAGQGLAAPVAEDPQRPLYDATQGLLNDPLRLGAQQIDLLASAQGAAASYEVDGMKYDGRAMDRTAAANAIQYLKEAAGLNLEERRKPQTGTLKISREGTKHELKISTAGSSAGESMRLEVDPKNRFDFKLKTLGFSPVQEPFMEDLTRELGGIVLLAMPKGQGLTSLFYTVLRGHDAFVYHIQTVERTVEQDLEGVTQNPLPPGATPADEAKAVAWAASQEPDILGLSSIEDAKSAATLIKSAADGKRVYIAVRGATTFEAIRAWRKVVGDDALAAKELRVVVAGRLVRKLCEACKIPYKPDPAQVKKLGMNPEQVTELFQARKQPMRDAKGNPVPCTFCNDLAFKGRTGVYETLIVDEDVKAAIAAGGQDNPLKMAFRKQKGRYLQEEALAKVQEGQTSVEEVLRILRGEAGSSRDGGGSTKSPSSSPPSAPSSSSSRKSKSAPAPTE